MFNELSARNTPWALRAREESGQGLVEYTLILALISVVSIVIMQTVGTDVRAVFTGAANALETVVP